MEESITKNGKFTSSTKINKNYDYSSPPTPNRQICRINTAATRMERNISNISYKTAYETAFETPAMQQPILW